MLGDSTEKTALPNDLSVLPNVEYHYEEKCTGLKSVFYSVFFNLHMSYSAQALLSRCTSIYSEYTQYERAPILKKKELWGQGKSGITKIEFGVNFPPHYS